MHMGVTGHEPSSSWWEPKKLHPVASQDTRFLVSRKISRPSFLCSPYDTQCQLINEWLGVQNFNYALSYIWANDQTVQAALGVRQVYSNAFSKLLCCLIHEVDVFNYLQDNISEWVRCNESISYTYDVENGLDYQRNLSTTGLQVLIYKYLFSLILYLPMW